VPLRYSFSAWLIRPGMLVAHSLPGTYSQLDQAVAWGDQEVRVRGVRGCASPIVLAGRLALMNTAFESYFIYVSLTVVCRIRLYLLLPCSLHSIGIAQDVASRCKVTTDIPRSWQPFSRSGSLALSAVVGRHPRPLTTFTNRLPVRPGSSMASFNVSRTQIQVI
jgi:hypothetical protein